MEEKIFFREYVKKILHFLLPSAHVSEYFIPKWQLLDTRYKKCS